MKKTTGLLAVLVTMILIFSGCQNTAKTEQSGYKIFCRNEDAVNSRTLIPPNFPAVCDSVLP